MPSVPQHAARVAEKLGVGFVWDKKQPLWTGRAVNLAFAFIDPFYTPSNMIFHELAHYVVAPKGLRHLPNYGWYDTPSGPRVDANKGANDRSEEETTAQALTYLAMRQYQLDWVEACESDGWSAAGVIEYGEYLVGEGLVEGVSLRPYFIDGVLPS